MTNEKAWRMPLVNKLFSTNLLLLTASILILDEKFKKEHFIIIKLATKVNCWQRIKDPELDLIQHNRADKKTHILFPLKSRRSQHTAKFELKTKRKRWIQFWQF